MLNNNKAKKELKWFPLLTFEETIQMTVDWYKHLFLNLDVEEITKEQIDYVMEKRF